MMMMPHFSETTTSSDHMNFLKVYTYLFALKIA